MVGRSVRLAASLAAGLTGLLAALGGPALAASPWDQMFPDPGSCYQRAYSVAHLATHPQQRVTAMTLAAAPAVPSDPWPAVSLRLRLRGPGGGTAEALAYCQNTGAATLYCTMEGDAGAFTIEPVRAGAVLVSVSRDGMSFETDTDLVTLEARRGDDRSFLLQPARGCR